MGNADRLAIYVLSNSLSELADAAYSVLVSLHDDVTTLRAVRACAGSTAIDALESRVGRAKELLGVLKGGPDVA